MSAMKCVVIGAIVVLVSAGWALPQDKVDVSGEWEMTTATPQGDITMTLKFVQTGEKLAVAMSSEFGEFSGEGTIKGNDIEWTMTMDTSNGSFTIIHKGKVDGDTMSGEVEAGNFGTLTWKAKKKTA
jgi:hypothetical protein